VNNKFLNVYDKDMPREGLGRMQDQCGQSLDM